MIKLLLLDVDGVLTDGSLTYSGSGMCSLVFNVKDGAGIEMLLNKGVLVGVVSAGGSKALLKRCKDLEIPIVKTNVINKYYALIEIIKETGVNINEIMYIGDDLGDLEAFCLAGVKVAVSDAVEEVKIRADIITKNPGGHGAVREMCDFILGEYAKI